MSHLALVLVAGTITYGLRVGLIVMLGDRDLPDRLQRVVTHVKPAAFSAMAVIAVLRFPGLGPAHLIAAGVVVVAALRHVDLLITMASGVAVLLLLTGFSQATP